jgi:hypothetical protein
MIPRIMDVTPIAPRKEEALFFTKLFRGIISREFTFTKEGNKIKYINRKLQSQIVPVRI